MLPRRYSVAVQEGVVREAGERLAQAHRQAESAPRGWKALAVALPVAAVLWVVLKDRSVAEARNSLPFNRSVVVTDNLAGVGSPSARFLAAAAAHEAREEAMKPSRSEDEGGGVAPSPPPAPPAAPKPRMRTSTAAGRAAPSPRKSDCPSCELAKAGFAEATEPFEEQGFGAAAAARVERAKLKLPLGTRLRVVLTDPVTTGAEGAPVTAEVASEVVVAGQVAVPAKTLVEGLAFASELDDRARVLFRALVLNGDSVAIEGVALGERSEMGLPGKLVRKGSSKGKRGGGLLLRALGAGVGASLGGLAGGLVGSAAAEAGYGVSRDLRDLERQWAVSDKGIRVPAGAPAVVYLRSEVALP